MPRDVRTGLLLDEPRSIEESRPGEIRGDRKAARVRRVFGAPAAGKDYAAFGASVAGGLAFWDTFSGISGPFREETTVI